MTGGIPRINVVQTWTGAQTFDAGITINADPAITFTNQGAGDDPLLSSNSAAQFLSLTGGLIVSANLLSNADIIMADTRNIRSSTGTGTKIGTTTSQKLSFWNATPVIQPGHISDPSGGATIDAEAREVIDAILADLAEMGLQAST